MNGHETEPQKLRLGISTCLLGEEVRHDGGHKRNHYLLKVLGEYVEWTDVCPELEMGLGVPREAMRLVGKARDSKLITIKTKVDHTDGMQEWSRTKFKELEEASLDGFVLKRASPSCGLYRVKVYGKAGIPSPHGRGIFATELKNRFPLLPLEEEGRLNDAILRENFIARIFAYRRLRAFASSDPSAADIVRFHSSEKLLLMAHDSKAPARLGRLVAEAGKRDRKELMTDYAGKFMETLEGKATRKRHTNVLEHMMGYIKKTLPSEDKAELLESIHQYRKQLLPLIVPIKLLKHHLRKHDAPEWIQIQSYLDPYPEQLALRNHI